MIAPKERDHLTETASADSLRCLDVYKFLDHYKIPIPRVAL